MDEEFSKLLDRLVDIGRLKMLVNVYDKDLDDELKELKKKILSEYVKKPKKKEVKSPYKQLNLPLIKLNNE